MTSLLVVGVACLFAASRADPITFDKTDWFAYENDRIEHLPDLEVQPTFKMYSGYLEASTTTNLFYWLNECTNSSTRTLIIWFNGGPGCSSLDGLFYENGPYMFDKHTGRLEANSKSWNRLGHTLYIEMPVGVGYSYSTLEAPTGTRMNDDAAAQDNLNALKYFFRKYPEYESFDLYIAGESYAGVYIPILVDKMINDRTPILDNLKGVVIGNGLLHASINMDTFMYFTYYHGLIGPNMWGAIQRECCDEAGVCNFREFRKEDCMLKVAKVHHVANNEGLNLYNLYDDCAPNPERERHPVSSRLFGKPTFQSSAGDNDELKGGNLQLVPTCTNATAITHYLNRRDVKTALHANHDVTWQLCSADVLGEYNQQYQDMSEYVQRILRERDDTRVLLYFGDVDMACNYMGGERFVDQLGYDITQPRGKWSVEVNGIPQIAGFYKEFDRLRFVTVKGAGHMVPSDKPQEAFEMLQKFIADEPL